MRVALTDGVTLMFDKYLFKVVMVGVSLVLWQIL